MAKKSWVIAFFYRNWQQVFPAVIVSASAQDIQKKCTELHSSSEEMDEGVMQLSEQIYEAKNTFAVIRQQ